MDHLKSLEIVTAGYKSIKIIAAKCWNKYPTEYQTESRSIHKIPVHHVVRHYRSRISYNFILKKSEFHFYCPDRFTERPRGDRRKKIYFWYTFRFYISELYFWRFISKLTPVFQLLMVADLALGFENLAFYENGTLNFLSEEFKIIFLVIHLLSC